MERRETEHHPRRRDGPHEAEMRQEFRSQHEASSVTRSDEGGIYRLSREGDRSIFSVKPREGEVREWPVNTEEERAALPEPLRAKLRELEEIRKSARPADGAPDRGPGGPPPGRHPEGA
ncbi:MAG: hypothetical protein LDL31_12460 [Prosthecobacter sp.]|nr:hypothetical protein [Prosthecobacter sp.]